MLEEQQLAPAAIKGLTVGRIVHYVLEDGRNANQHRPAIIVRVWDPASSTVQLQVFTDGDGSSHANDGLPNVVWKTSVCPDQEGKRAGTWHWIEPA